ncbi:MAG: hypothetical protein WBS33_15945, partial [Verrucomicrobiia bacterium]
GRSSRAGKRRGKNPCSAVSHNRFNHDPKTVQAKITPFCSVLLALAGCSTTQHAAKWDYKTVSSTSDEILNTPVAQGWIPVGISVTPDGNKWFLLKRAKTDYHASRWEYKTVSSTSDEILNTPMAQGWSVVSFCVTANGDKWFLLRHPKAQG